MFLYYSCGSSQPFVGVPCLDYYFVDLSESKNLSQPCGQSYLHVKLEIELEMVHESSTDLDIPQRESIVTSVLTERCLEIPPVMHLFVLLNTRKEYYVLLGIIIMLHYEDKFANSCLFTYPMLEMS